jgi:RNA processing factor Prp31
MVSKMKLDDVNSILGTDMDSLDVNEIKAAMWNISNLHELRNDIQDYM